MWLTNSSVGRKFVMALTGAFLVLFVTFHVLMNGVAILWPAAYNVICAFLGANWYALVGTLVLAAGFLLHIIYALWLTVQNRKARGNDRYAVTSKPKQVEWASQNMLVLGIVVLAFFVVHLIQFWAKMQLAEITGELYTGPCGHEMPPAAGTLFIQLAFGQWWTLPVYIIGFVALWFHMTHGFWSMFQSAGWNNGTWLCRLKCVGNWWTTLVIGLFIIEAVVFTVQAQNEAYFKCPELQKQYCEMAQEHKSEAACDAPCLTDCAAPCENACEADACAEDCVAPCENACTADVCPENCADCKNVCGKCEQPNENVEQ